MYCNPLSSTPKANSNNLSTQELKVKMYYNPFFNFFKSILKRSSFQKLTVKMYCNPFSSNPKPNSNNYKHPKANSKNVLQPFPQQSPASQSLIVNKMLTMNKY